MLHSERGQLTRRLLRMSGTIGSAVPSQWAAIKQLIGEASLPTDDLDESTCSFFRVYADGSAIVGAVALEPLGNDAAMLRSLVVAPIARGRGVGHSLVENVEAWARSQNITDIFLLTTTADRFFSRLGYQRVDRDVAPDSVKAHEQFRALCPASAVLMSKRI